MENVAAYLQQNIKHQSCAHTVRKLKTIFNDIVLNFQKGSKNPNCPKNCLQGVSWDTIVFWTLSIKKC